jgi:hypothetical protein
LASHTGYTTLAMTDFIAYLKSSVERFGDHFDLQQLVPGDELKVVTSHTEYVFRIIEDHIADLNTARPDRPRGRVKILGCTFGRSSSINADQLFCGGNLQFTYQLNGVSMTHTTTTIRAIYLRRQARSSSD